jgi:general stress protein 26
MKQQSPANLDNLAGAPAIEKIRKIAEASRSCLFGTMHEGGSLDVRPMAVQKVDESGRLWFLSGRDSNKNHRLEHDSRVQLIFANPGASEYMSLSGRATVSDERALREKFWSPMATTWFPGGVDDPQLTVIGVEVDGGHYWDTVHGKAVTLAKIAAGAVTGRNLNVGIEGAVRP